MPGKGRPFVPNDPRHPPGAGRPKLEYLEAMRSLAPDAVEVLRKALKSKNRREALHALSPSSTVHTANRKRLPNSTRTLTRRTA